MIKNQIKDGQAIKDKLFTQTLRQLRQKAKRLSVPVYSRKTKALLVDSIIKYQEIALIEDKTIEENSLSVDEEKELSRDANDNEFFVDENWKINTKDSRNITSDQDSNLKRLLSDSFPDKKISVTDNKDGSQTIFIL